MKRILFLGVVLAVPGLAAQTASLAGTISADAEITAVQSGPDFDDTITLTNTSGAGNDSIATFWFAWVPGKDFLPTDPISVSLPAGWRDAITHGGSTDGYAIQFDAISTADNLAPGGSLTFGFATADSPAALMGNSPFYPSFPVLTSFVYSTGPLRGDGSEFLVTFASVPEPSSLVLAACGAIGSLGRWRSRRGAHARRGIA